MIRIGLTGGIGSGKSSVRRLFSVLGIAAYDTDSKAKELMGGALSPQIRLLLSDKAYCGNELDREYIANRVFHDPELLNRLNGIVHPAVVEDFIKWAELQDRSGAKYVIMECAILFDAGFDKYVDRTITVSAPEEERIRRVVRRGGMSEAQVRERIACQISDRQRERQADYTINNMEEAMIIPQVIALHNIFINEDR